jgi:outer membrane immunogenic protein
LSIIGHLALLLRADRGGLKMRVSMLGLAAAGVASFGVVWVVPAAAQDASFDWTGPYLGVALGSASTFGTTTFDYTEGTAGTNNVYFSNGNAFFASESRTPLLTWPGTIDLGEVKGRATSVEAGFDYQMGQLVVGAVVDGTYFDTGAMDWTSGLVDDVGLNHTVSASAELDHLYSLRSRVGIGMDRLLLFGTGGLAAGHVDLSTGATLTTDDFGYGTADWEGESNDWRMGFMVGAGAEYALTDNLAIKAEALYYDLGDADVTAAGEGTYASTPQDVAPYSARVDLSGVIVRTGVQLRF